jgi:hypothetical protein
MIRSLGLSLVSLVCLAGCPSESDSSGAGSTGASTTGMTMANTGSGASTAPTAEVGSGATSDSATSDSATSGGAETGAVVPAPRDCDGAFLECGNGMDDDGDGLIDVLDPECTGPCDDDEGSFQTGLPGDNVDCRQDCFFDGNSGQGDDGCDWNLRCDPANPGANIGCEYTGGGNCPTEPVPPSMQCVEFCGSLTPPGCDCYGCCTVQTPGGPVDIFLNSGPECSLANLDACQPCTPQIDVCGTPCDPEDCDLCFGETELPQGCDTPNCESGDPCESDDLETCPDGFYCSLSCCYPDA